MVEVEWYTETMVEIITQRLPEHWKWIITPMVAEVEAAPEGASWFEKKEVKI